MTKKEKQPWRGDTYEILGGKAIIYTTLSEVSPDLPVIDISAIAIIK